MATEKSRLEPIIEANTAKFKEGMAKFKTVWRLLRSMAKLARVEK